MSSAANTYIDVSSLIRATGPATGMIRVEREVAKFALAASDANVCFYDIATNTYRSVAKAWLGPIMGEHARLQPPVQARTGWVRFMPDRARALMALERLRLTTTSRAVARAADRLQRLLLAIRAHRFPIDDEQGQRLSIVPFDMAIGGALALGPEDVVLSVSSDWWQKAVAPIAALKLRQRFRLVVLCYDIIPLHFPQFFPADDVERFRTYWEGMFQSADLVLVNSRAVENDIKAYCRSNSIPAPQLAVVPLGCDLAVDDSKPGALPSPALERDKFALFVSTVEPRKNHRLLLSVWRRLLADGIVDRTGFKLVFVGRRGWMNDEVQAQIDGDEVLRGSLLYFENLDDEDLARLYDNAAFCLYPSLYEGFGLPVVEAFVRGKAVIASNGGALVELAEGVVPCLSPNDEDAWYDQMADWMQFPEHPKVAAALIAGRIRLHRWSDVVADMLKLARGERPVGVT
jgi:glycosyltransferase involved in cell wall biosynthesis